MYCIIFSKNSSKSKLSFLGCVCQNLQKEGSISEDGVPESECALGKFFEGGWF